MAKRVVAESMAELAALAVGTPVQIQGRYMLSEGRRLVREGKASTAAIRLSMDGRGHVLIAVTDDFQPVCPNELVVVRGEITDDTYMDLTRGELALAKGKVIDFPERPTVWIGGEVTAIGRCDVRIAHWHQPVQIDFRKRRHDFAVGDVLIAMGQIREEPEISLLALATAERVEESELFEDLDTVEMEFARAGIGEWRDSLDALKEFARFQAKIGSP